MKNLKTLSFLFVAALVISLSSCNKEADLLDIDSFTDSSVELLQSGAVGKNHCLEFIFPISIEFVDASSAEVSSYEDLFETVKAWFDANDVEKSKENKPQLVFPIQVINDDGEVIDIASQEELRELRKECPKTGRCKGKRGKGFKCFDLVFPLSVSIGGEEVTFEDRASLKVAIKAYKEEAGDDAERPTLVFPVTVEYEDGTQATANSKEELRQLRKDCRDEEG